MAKVRVLVVDDHALFRKGLIALLSIERQIQVIAEADDGEAAVAKAAALAPDVVLMDIRMPRMDGIQATQLLRAKVPKAKVIVLTVFDEEGLLFDAIKAGAHGYLLKNVGPEELVRAILGVVNGEAPLSGVMAAKLLEEFARAWSASTPAVGPSLTQREQEILMLVAEGASNKQIAAKLFITEGTVKNHLHNILDKLHLHNRAEAAAYATRSGLAGSPVDHEGLKAG